MDLCKILLCALLSAAALLPGNIATAQVVGCVATVTVYIECDGPNGCHNKNFPIDTCQAGCSGGCNCGYGLCCGNNYTSCNATGSCYTCTSPSQKAEHAAEDKTQGVAKSDERERPPRRYLVSQLMFVPDRCARSYGIVDRGSSRNERGGL
jgi:hypothetical protein